MAFESIPILLGCSIIKECDVNYLIVKRYEGEKASILCSCEENGKKFNNRAIDYSLLTGLLGEKLDNSNEHKSYYPAVTNIICFKIKSYIDTLMNTEIELPEYILCNNTESIRLETVLQDYVVLTNENSKINSLNMQRWLCFNPVKEISNINDFYTPDDGEKKLYHKNRKKLIKLGWKIGENAVIYIDPLISSTTESLMEHFKGNIEIESNSKLVVIGNLHVNNLSLKGSLTIRIKEGGYVKIRNMHIKNKGIEHEINHNNYFKKVIITRGELILEYGNGVYEVEGEY